ncbi:MAG: hypothetical protein WB678_19820 [Stellaceae bacterium]
MSRLDEALERLERAVARLEAACRRPGAAAGTVQLEPEVEAEAAKLQAATGEVAAEIAARVEGALARVGRALGAEE